MQEREEGTGYSDQRGCVDRKGRGPAFVVRGHHCRELVDRFGGFEGCVQGAGHTGIVDQDVDVLGLGLDLLDRGLD